MKCANFSFSFQIGTEPNRELERIIKAASKLKYAGESSLSSHTEISAQSCSRLQLQPELRVPHLPRVHHDGVHSVRGEPDPAQLPGVRHLDHPQQTSHHLLGTPQPPLTTNAGVRNILTIICKCRPGCRGLKCSKNIKSLENPESQSFLI